MTSQTLPAPVPLIPLPPASDIFPPSFIHTVEVELIKILNRDHPGVRIDIRNTWFTLYETKSQLIPAYTDFPTKRPTTPTLWVREFKKSIRLCDSFIDFFLGSLVPTEYRTGWFTIPDTADINFQINTPTAHQINLIYTELEHSLLHAFNQSLMSYWGNVEHSGKTRRALFITERVSAIQMEAQVGVTQKSLTSQQGIMLETMLLYSFTNNPTALKKHGVFSLSLTIGAHDPLHLAGMFVLSHVGELDRPVHKDARLGPVLLYSPNNGLEGFDSFELLIASLSRRLNDPVQKRWFLANAPLTFITELEAKKHGNVSPHTWDFIPMQGDFLSSQFLSQISKQQFDFAHCVEAAKMVGLKSDAFLELVTRALDPRYQFDNFLNLDWNDRYILHTSMPNWWQAMSTENKDIWLTSAKTLGDSIIDIEQLTDQYMTNNLSIDPTLASDYIDTLVRSTLIEKNALLNADDIKVIVTHIPALLPPYGPHMSQPADPQRKIVRHYSLISVATELPSKLKLASAHSVVVTDAKGDPVKGLDSDFISALINKIDDPATMDSFLKTCLQTSVYARALKDLSARLSRTQMRMGYVADNETNFPPACKAWIKAVIEAPKATANRQVNKQKILVKYIAVNGVQLSNVLQFAPETDDTHQGIVFCTFNAPDGVTFRWFKDFDSAKEQFLDNSKFSKYLMLQIPVANRPKALRSLQLDQPLKNYRLPDFFKYLPSPLPLPSLLWNAITLVDQTAELLEENHALKIKHLTLDGKAHLLNAREIETNDSASMHLGTSILLLFLPPPVSIPIALGLSLYKAWDGFKAIEEEDYRGAAKELLIALSYLVTAGISRGALADNTRISFKVFRGAPRPIVSAIDAEGETHISVLTENLMILPSSPPSGTIPFNAAKFQEINIDNEVLYVPLYSNLFGQRLLYRRHPETPAELTQRGEFAMLNEVGQWVKSPYQALGISAGLYNKADIELATLIEQWPASKAAATDAQKVQFVIQINELAATGASDFQEISAYSEAGSDEINSVLRAGQSTEDSRDLLYEFYQLSEYLGVAFRAAHISLSAFGRLQSKIGTIFADRGVQSASVSRFNATEWAADMFVTQHASDNTKAIFLIYDRSVPKKNMFTNFLGDHVGIAPQTLLQLMAFKTINDINYAYFSAPDWMPTHYTDLFTGAQTAFPYIEPASRTT
ncbi:MAG TPA: hypothetical protein VGC62_13895 [Pseudomonas sp.]|uniref:hypothetical protein n=1 Tax=Pseudomonas sp. TaxID=306 RepID=UPI002ED8F223